MGSAVAIARWRSGLAVCVRRWTSGASSLSAHPCLADSHGFVIEPDADEQRLEALLVARIFAQRPQSRIPAQEDEAVGAFVVALLQQCHAGVGLAEGQVGNGGFIRAGIHTRA